ncbi:MAG: shikimate dehydrogenase [Candidatus Thiodiazotropha lotti]|uniref:Shikimate dehydrogenase (NADP(+)) n=1 Tax=Candidatus Thiodiazotropha lotti TaxID=2792787 RepID=A0A9E4K685_9GAMM|nr:shikimate dehydrogenase [Candidatus Thiodiazotropha lotti]ODB98783.1 shikimate dehydrogenase [Candidatus Thiodiazotropha endoloripes]MCG7940506.1 shikimate dehydrogenase [Candidatus Thiodiazotropha lotti]MCG7986691.1 shikimate dehydrogenase [Candidatus Thiodiazotropha lotti]MCG8001911.1 shikimate dehydrogenase [Candidatus Thiodiazotropha lotti]
MDKYAVIGNPIAHSKSPEIHAAFARQTGEAVTYERILGDKQNFAGDVHRFMAEGGQGLNVTVPFKEEAWRLADELSDRAHTAGAVNTLIRLDNNLLRGDNTDGVGLVRDLTVNQGFRMADKRILMLGAGGAVRGVMRPLLEQKPKRIIIANRTASKAYALASVLTSYGQVAGCGLEELQGMQFDLIINGTAAGLDGEVPNIPDDVLTKGGWCYDMLYSNQATPFQIWGKAHRAARSLDGLGMLVEQAAESFRLWRSILPETPPVISMLRD